jgi:hypothetical protein
VTYKERVCLQNEYVVQRDLISGVTLYCTEEKKPDELAEDRR